MIRTSICLLIIFFITESKGASFGVLGGFNQTKVTETSNTTNLIDNAEIGFKFGLIADFYISENFDLRSGLIYSWRKYQVQEFEPTIMQFYDVEFKFNYIDIPLIFELKVFSWLNLFAGPILAFNNINEATLELAGTTTKIEVTDTKSLYLLGQVGLNFDFGRIGMDIYYERGFGEIYKGGEKDFSQIGLNLIYWINPQYEYSFSDY